MTRLTTAFGTTTALIALGASVASAQDLPQADNEWFAAGSAALEAALTRKPNTGRAVNVILMISDGNGVGTNYASRLFAGQQAGGHGDEFLQHHETFPNLALTKTYNTNAQTPDSAGTGTAMMSGIKTKAGIVGLTAAANRGDCTTLPGNEVASLNEIMYAAGRATGVVSTARITHATPASAYAKSVDRNFEDSVPEACTEQADIATQLIEAMEAGTVLVAMGGGRRHFLGEDIVTAEGGTGRRAAGEDLIERARSIETIVVQDDTEFAAAARDGTPILGLFEDSHMQYEADRDGEPSLAEMTGAAIEALSAAGGDAGFFLQVEAGRVDHANHDGNLARAVREQQAFAEAVAMADEMTDDADTLIVVTADHEHAIAFNGYCGRGSDVLGLCMGIDSAGEVHTGEPELADDGLPYTVVGYLNGPGSVLEPVDDAAETKVVERAVADAAESVAPELYKGTRADVTEEDATDLDYLQQALIPKPSETHSGEDVAVYAKGPFAHLFDGTIEQNVIFHVIRHAATVE